MSIDQLQTQLGKVYVWEEPPQVVYMDGEVSRDPEFDRGGLHALKAKTRINQ